MTLGLALSALGAARLPAAHLHLIGGAMEAVSAAPVACLTQTVRITLASEQVGFCAPASLPFNTIEDSNADAEVNYAGLNQIEGYGIVNIKATAPGNAPGPGRPVYTSGSVAAYRQAVWNMEAAQNDRNVSKGPSGLFWSETVPSVQIDVSLSLSTGTLQVRSIEWYVEHDNRLWSFILTWDTAMQNASEWEAASKNMSVQKAGGGNLADTAINLGNAFLEPQTGAGISSNGAPVDVGLPAWWSGVCNDNHFYADMGVHSTPLGATWHGVLACGPKNSSHLVYFFSGAWGEFEFQCVELVMRFLYLEWGIAPWAGNGNTIKNNPPAAMVFYPNNATHGIVPGDVITENASTQNSAGHTLIVTGTSSLDGSGTGTISIMEQNASNTGQRLLNVVSWQVQPDAWSWGQTIQGWLHVKGNQDDGDTDQTFTPGTGANDRVNAIAMKPNGKIMIAGEFSSYNGVSRNKVARLNSDGTLDVYNPLPGVATAVGTSHVYTLAGYTNGTENWKSLIAGHFDTYNNNARKNIARLNSNGSLDTTFTPPPELNADIYKIVIVNPDDPNSEILVGGAGLLLRLNSNGTLDATFSVTTDNIVRDIAVQSSDGKILIGGDFSKVNGIDRAGVARLKSDGSLDTAFGPGTGTGANAVKAVALDADGRILIGGTFTTYNGTSRNKMARLNGDGSLDTSFTPGTGFSGSSDYVQVILAQTDGRILIGGDFSSYNGNALNHFGRLNNNGSRDTTFFASMDGSVQALALQPPDGKIVIGGDFTNRVARLYNRVESCYTMTAQATPIAGGSVTIDTTPNCPGGKYLSGALVQITAVLNPDYWLVNWSGDASGSANPLTVTMDRNKSVTATLMTSPGFFNKSSPENGATDMPAGILLNWGTSLGASSYEYCIYTINLTDCDTNKNPSPWISTGTSTNATLSNLLPSVTYHWQVRARNIVDSTDAAGGWWSFVRNGAPAVPVTVSPAGAIYDTRPVYVWNASNGATGYHVTVYSFSASAYVIDDSVGKSTCSGGVCTYQPSMELPLGNYQFRVAASESGTSDFSPWRTFSVGLGIFLPWIASPGK